MLPWVLALLCFLPCGAPTPESRTFYREYSYSMLSSIHGENTGNEVTNLAVSTDGRAMYWAATMTGNVKQLSVGRSIVSVVKQDTRTGNVIWQRNMTNLNRIAQSQATALAVDSNDSVIVCGTFLGDVGVGGQVLRGHTYRETMYLLKFNSTGDFQWATPAGGNTVNVCRGMAVDKERNIIHATGSFIDKLLYGVDTQQPLLMSPFLNVFLLQILPNGTLQAAISGNASGSPQMIGADVAVDRNGNPIVVGTFTGTISFTDTNGGQIIIPATTGLSVFMVKYMRQLNEGVLWATTVGGSSSTVCPGAHSVAAADEQVFFGGCFQGTLLFMVDGNYMTNLTLVNPSTTSWRAYFAAYNQTSGHVLWAQRGGGEQTDYGLYLAANSQGTMWATGFFEGSCQFMNASAVSPMENTSRVFESVNLQEPYGVFITQIGSSGLLGWGTTMKGTIQPKGIATYGVHLLGSGTFRGAIVLGNRSSSILSPPTNVDSYLSYSLDLGTEVPLDDDDDDSVFLGSALFWVFCSLSVLAVILAGWGFLAITRYGLGKFFDNGGVIIPLELRRGPVARLFEVDVTNSDGEGAYDSGGGSSGDSEFGGFKTFG